MNLLWLIPAAPLLGFLILFLSQGRLSKPVVAVVGAGSVTVAAVLTFMVGLGFTQSGESAYSQHLWTWIDVGGFSPAIILYLDGLSLVMIGVITGVGALIHIYAAGYMIDESDYSRFFAYMNLFVFAMLMLVLGDNLLVLYLGWEGVGLCSYLLIGYFHEDPANGYAARKAFVVTRIGDTAMALGMFLLFRELGTLEIQSLLQNANATWAGGSPVCTLAALLILGGAVGKSAQLPLQTWLPDAMAGPTPVSALIHAATMVTAGVYLIARLHDLYLLSDFAQFAVAVVGVISLFIASFAALCQSDLKRILAYSTMSQIGYMFLALGVGAWSAAIFHLMTHAFFKALLFLTAGTVIKALHHEQDIFKMGGLYKRMPLAFACMLIGSAALSALPLTSGWFSKDLILLQSWDYAHQGPFFWSIAAAAAFLTSLYSVRMIYIVFFGDAKTEAHDQSGIAMNAPLVILATLALVGGMFGFAAVAPVLPDGGIDGGDHYNTLFWVTTAIPLVGIIFGYMLFSGRLSGIASLLESGFALSLKRYFATGWGFDALYDLVLVSPFKKLSVILKPELVDGIYNAVVIVARGFNRYLSNGENGSLRWYAMNMAAGLVLVLLFIVGVL